jgi:alpha-tubulin suppressor-like RCC1 family protein
MGCFFRLVIFAALTSSPAQAAAQPTPANTTTSGFAPLPILNASGLHKFTLVKQKGESEPRWAYATITEVSNAGVALQTWETNADDYWWVSSNIWKAPAIIPFDQFTPADQQFIQDWAKLHPSGPAAASPVAASPGATGIACFFSEYSCQVDTSGVLKGKTITAIASSGTHFLALCADGTLAAWGQNVYGQLGNGQHGVDALSLVPVLVDTTGALKGKSITSIGAFVNGSYAICSDGSLYTWGLPPLYGGMKRSDAIRFLRDEPALFDPVALKDKQVTAVSVEFTGMSFSALCSDGNLFDWETVAHTPGSLVAVRMDNQGSLKGKKIIQIGNGDTALCADGTLSRWEFLLVPGLFSMGTKDEPVSVPDQTGLLKGKTIVAILGNADRVLCSDGTVAEWGEEDTGKAADRKNHYPQPVNVAVPADKMITAMAGDLLLYSDKTLGLAPLPSGQDATLDPAMLERQKLFEPYYRKETDFVGALQNQAILAIARDLVLFKEPGAPSAAP